MKNIISLLTLACLATSVFGAPLSTDQCQFEGTRLYVQATISQRIEDANRIPLTSEATRYETYPVINIRTLREKGAENIRRGIAYGFPTYAYDGVAPGSPPPSYARQSDGAVRSTYTLQGRISATPPPHSGDAKGINYGTLHAYADMYYQDAQQPCLITDIEVHSTIQ